MKSNFNPKKIALALVGAIVIGSGAYLIASDHTDAPLVTGTTSDLTDIYAFASPTTPTNMVFVLNVQGKLTPGASATAKFDEDVMLQVKIDNSTPSDAGEELTLQVTFANDSVFVYGPTTPDNPGLKSFVQLYYATVSGKITPYKADPIVSTKDGVSVFAGLRDDPFFFDLDRYHDILSGAQTGFAATGIDTFAGLNVLSVVIELPKSLLGSGDAIAVWGTSSRKSK